MTAIFCFSLDGRKFQGYNRTQLTDVKLVQSLLHVSRKCCFTAVFCATKSDEKNHDTQRYHVLP